MMQVAVKTNAKPFLVLGGVAVIAALCVFLYFRKTDSSFIDIPMTRPASLSEKAESIARKKKAGRHGNIDGPIVQQADALGKFLAIKTLANHGNPTAQRQLAEAYGRCISVNADPQRFLASYEVIAKQSQSQTNAHALVSAARNYVEECRVVDNGAVVPIEARGLWLKQASEGGDLAAKAILARESLPPMRGNALKELIGEVVSSADAAAVFELGQLLVANSDDTALDQYVAVASGPVSGYAWSIAGCQIGLSCNAGSDVMNSVCLNTGGCASENFESFVKTNLISPADAKLLDAKVREVKALLHKS